MSEVNKSWLELARCPDTMCDNNGTTVDQGANGEIYPLPCPWCEEKKRVLEHLNNKVAQGDLLQGFFEFHKKKFGGGFYTNTLETTLKHYRETLNNKEDE